MVKNRLLEIRLKKGYRLEKEFAEFLGISVYQYNRYEKNVVQPSTEVILNIAEKLNMKVEDIIYRVPQ